ESVVHLAAVQAAFASPESSFSLRQPHTSNLVTGLGAHFAADIRRAATSSYESSTSGLLGRVLRPKVASFTSLNLVWRFFATTFSHANFPIIGTLLPCKQRRAA